MEQRFGKADFVPAQVRDRGAQRGVVDGNPNHQAERQAAVDDTLSELTVLAAVFFVEVQCGGIMGHRAEQHVVGFGDGAPDGVVENLPNLEFLEIQTRHGALLSRLRGGRVRQLT